MKKIHVLILILAAFIALFFAMKTAAQTPSFQLFEETNGGKTFSPENLSFELPPVGQTKVWYNKSTHAVFSNNGELGWMFDDNPRDPSRGQGDEPVLSMNRTAVNQVEVWVNFGGFKLPTTANIHPSGRGPIAFFRAEWYIVNGRVKLLVKNHYLVMSYLDVNTGQSSRRETMPESFKDRTGLAGEAWQVPQGPLVSWGVVESHPAGAVCYCTLTQSECGQAASYTLMQIEGEAGQVSIGKFSVRIH